jgi:hypothetical protein
LRTGIRQVIWLVLTPGPIPELSHFKSRIFRKLIYVLQDLQIVMKKKATNLLATSIVINKSNIKEGKMI